MTGNSFGTAYRITTFGESHGVAVGVVIEGVPARLKIDVENIRGFLARRKTNQSHLTSVRSEDDAIEILSGTDAGLVTLGTPVCIVVRNQDQKAADYGEQAKVFRPSHADFTYWKKYGVAAASGGGRASARETVARVIAGAVAEQILKGFLPDLEVAACVAQVKDVFCNNETLKKFSRLDVEKSPVRCPDMNASNAMIKLIEQAKDNGDSVGGVIYCAVKNYPAGCGEPVFDKLEAELGKAILSLPAAKGFDIGSGFFGCGMFGSEHNDPIAIVDDKVKTVTNYSGGIQGGISNGEEIYFRAGFKPVSTIFKNQKTIGRDLKETKFNVTAGRHDPCVLPRAVVMVEAMTLVVLLDFYLRQKIYGFSHG